METSEWGKCAAGAITLRKNRHTMNKAKTILSSFVLLAALLAPGGSGLRAQDQSKLALDKFFSPSTSVPMSPDEDGFIRRWTLLEPISMQLTTNAIFTDSYIRETFYKEYFKGQFTAVPKDGEKVKLDRKTRLKWHALDSKLFNVKLFRFATNLSDSGYGVLFWAVTVIDCPEELSGVRMAVGSNSASMWWLNGEEAVVLSGDRRMVMDDCTSGLLTLKKGRNIVRGAVINGPGMSDFCLRFIDSEGNPVKNIKIISE